MMNPKMPSLADVPRNDLDAARAFYKARGERITPDEWEALWMLQDAPVGFERLTRRWRVI